MVDRPAPLTLPRRTGVEELRLKRDEARQPHIHSNPTSTDVTDTAQVNQQIAAEEEEKLKIQNDLASAAAARRGVMLGSTF